MHIHSRFSVQKSGPGTDSDRGEGLSNRHLQAEEKASRCIAPTPENLSDLQQGIKCRDIILAASRLSEVRTEDILSARRLKHVATVRHLVYKLTVELCPYSYPQIGRMLNRDHSTVIQGVKSITRRMYHEPHLQKLYDRIKQEVLPSDRQHDEEE